MRDGHMLLLIGQPGCGKGTQSRLITEALGIPALSTGDLLRAEVARHTPLGREIDALISQGQFVDDELIGNLLYERLCQPDCAHGAILDGYPRTLPQARRLEQMLSALDLPKPEVFYFEADEQAIVDRLCARRDCPVCGRIYNLEHQPPRQSGQCDHDGAALRQRSDDCRETVLARMNVFHRQTAPLLRYYAANSHTYRVHRIDANGRTQDVFQRVQDCLSGSLSSVAA